MRPIVTNILSVIAGILIVAAGVLVAAVTYEWVRYFDVPSWVVGASIVLLAFMAMNIKGRA